MMKSLSVGLLASLAMLTPLAGCQDKEPAPAQAAGGAKLLPRSVSDDMPAYDTVRSKAPLEEPKAENGSATIGTPAAQDAQPGETDSEASPRSESPEAGEQSASDPTPDAE